MSTFSDHFSIEVGLSNLTRAGKEMEKQSKGETTWNLRKEGGWEMFEKETEAVAEKVMRIVDRKDQENSDRKEADKSLQMS